MHIRRFLLVAMGPLLVAGCATAAPSDREEPEAVASVTSALKGNGQAHFVARLEGTVTAMAVVVGETGSIQPTSEGIPQRMEAIGATLTAVESDVAAMAAANAAPGATLPQLQQSGFDFSQLIQLVNQATTDAKNWLDIKGRSDSVSIGDRFTMQMLMNHLSQMGEMVTAVISAANQAILDMTRDVKGL